MSAGIVWIDAESFFNLGFGFREPLGNPDEGRGEIVARLNEIRGDPNRLAEMQDRLIGAVGQTNQRAAKAVVGLLVLGVEFERGVKLSDRVGQSVVRLH